MGEGDIHIFRLNIRLISNEISRAEEEYMNIPRPLTLLLEILCKGFFQIETIE